jgi:hypothetical protein
LGLIALYDPCSRRRISSVNTVGYFTLDNAENNTKAMVAIGEKLGFDGRHRHGRCIVHIINLAAKALLFGNDPDAFEEQLDGTSPLNYADYQLWRTQGPIGKLHNLVVDLRNVHKLYYGFLKIQREAGIIKPLQLIIDNETRWLSQLYMIRRAIQLKTSINVTALNAVTEQASGRTPGASHGAARVGPGTVNTAFPRIILRTLGRGVRNTRPSLLKIFGPLSKRNAWRIKLPSCDLRGYPFSRRF